jgi:hypothetical protein
MKEEHKLHVDGNKFRKIFGPAKNEVVEQLKY